MFDLCREEFENIINLFEFIFVGRYVALKPAYDLLTVKNIIHRSIGPIASVDNQSCNKLNIFGCNKRASTLITLLFFSTVI